MFEKILLVFIHGFCGSDATFNEFPDHLRKTLATLLPQPEIDILVYPQFETKGTLAAATDNFCTWLKKREAERREQPGGLYPLPTIIIGHSMGGLLAGDAFLRYRQELGQDEPTQFPHILGILGFDSPFYGVNHTNVTRSAYVNANKLRRQVVGFRLSDAIRGHRVGSPERPSSSRKILTYAVGGLVAAAGLLMNRENLPNLYSHALEHMDFVNVLMNPAELNSRVRALVECPDALFYCFYLQINSYLVKTKFCNLPGEVGIPSVGSDRFIALENTAKDEINGHTSMFEPTLNESYDDMTRQAAALIFKTICKYKLGPVTQVPAEPEGELISFN